MVCACIWKMLVSNFGRVISYFEAICEFSLLSSPMTDDMSLGVTLFPNISYASFIKHPTTDAVQSELHDAS